jgi:hypothetical protein
MPRRRWLLSGRHQGRDGQRSEWFVQDHGQGRAQTQRRSATIPRRGHGRRHRQTVEDRMQRQAERHPHPTQTARRSFRQRVRVSAGLNRTAFGHVMMVKGQESLHQEHHQKTAQHPERRLVDRPQPMRRMRQKTDQG